MMTDLFDNGTPKYQSATDIYEAVQAMAKRIGFKKIFVDIVLGGNSCRYKAVAEAYAEVLQELNYYDFMQNAAALEEALEENGVPARANPYSALCSAVYGKLKGLRLDAERQLIVESRAMLTAYDDFMFGLKANQALYSQQETMYRNRVAELQGKYENAVKGLLAAAQAQGVVLALPEVKRLEETV